MKVIIYIALCLVFAASFETVESKIINKQKIQ